MTKEQVLEIIEDEANHFGMSKEKAVEHLNTFGLTMDKILDNPLIDEPKIRTSVAMVYHAFA